MRSPSAIFGCPGFVLDYIALDSMHCGDLGVFQDAIGGLLFMEMSNKQWHRSYAAGISYLNAELKQFYAAHAGLSQIHLTANMIKGQTGSYPTLKSKAAECRHLAKFAVVLAHRQASGAAGRAPFHFPHGRLGAYSGEYRLLIVQMATNLDRYHESCMVEPFVVADCQNSMHAFLKALTDLRLLFRRGLAAAFHGKQPFPLRPKGHMLEHLVDDKVPMWGSPKSFWCYGDEDFVGIIKRIALQTKHPRTMEQVLLAKYRLFAGLHAHALAANE